MKKTSNLFKTLAYIAFYLLSNAAFSGIRFSLQGATTDINAGECDIERSTISTNYESVVSQSSDEQTQPPKPAPDPITIDGVEFKVGDGKGGLSITKLDDFSCAVTSNGESCTLKVLPSGEINVIKKDHKNSILPNTKLPDPSTLLIENFKGETLYEIFPTNIGLLMADLNLNEDLKNLINEFLKGADGNEKPNKDCEELFLLAAKHFRAYFDELPFSFDDDFDRFKKIFWLIFSFVKQNIENKNNIKEMSVLVNHVFLSYLEEYGRIADLVFEFSLAVVNPEFKEVLDHEVFLLLDDMYRIIASSSFDIPSWFKYSKDPDEDFFGMEIIDLFKASLEFLSQKKIENDLGGYIFKRPKDSNSAERQVEREKYSTSLEREIRHLTFRLPTSEYEKEVLFTNSEILAHNFAFGMKRDTLKKFKSKEEGLPSLIASMIEADSLEKAQEFFDKISQDPLKTAGVLLHHLYNKISPITENCEKEETSH